MVEVESHWEASMLNDPAPDNSSVPVLTVQWEPPDEADLAAVVGQFQLTYDPIAQTAILDSVNRTPYDASTLTVPLSPPAGTQSPDESEGWVYHAMGTIDAMEAKLKHVPQAQRAQFALVLEEFRASVFKECEFPPFPPERDVEFRSISSLACKFQRPPSTNYRRHSWSS